HLRSSRPPQPPVAMETAGLHRHPEREWGDAESGRGVRAGHGDPADGEEAEALDIPMSVALPIELQADGSHQAFPFLDTTLADLGIQESDVKERVVWVDTKKTQVKNKAGKLKEKETTILEVRVKAKKPGDKQLQEVLYSTEAHTDRSFCRTGMDIQPWKQGDPGKNKLKPVEMTMTLGLEKRQPGNTEAEDQRDI
uniref:Si:ch211-196f5.2 n=1 Tax=Poecilia latipinna TaxID=48699 RepID=A0A3B3USP1_9TELE